MVQDRPDVRNPSASGALGDEPRRPSVDSAAVPTPGAKESKEKKKKKKDKKEKKNKRRHGDEED